MARQARVRWYRGETAQARRLVADAIALLEREPAGPELADAYLEMGKEVWTSGRPEEALGWLRRAMTLAELCRRRGITEVAHWLSVSEVEGLFDLGRWDEALEQADQLLARHRDLDQRRTRGSA